MKKLIMTIGLPRSGKSIIAKYIFDKMKVELKGFSAKMTKVSAWESETSCATYFGR